MEITRTPLTRDELDCCVELTERLVRLRQSECKHLCIENIGPEIFGKLVEACYGRPLIITGEGPPIDINLDGLQVNGSESLNA